MEREWESVLDERIVFELVDRLGKKKTKEIVLSYRSELVKILPLLSSCSADDLREVARKLISLAGTIGSFDFLRHSVNLLEALEGSSADISSRCELTALSGYRVIEALDLVLKALKRGKI